MKRLISLLLILLLCAGMLSAGAEEMSMPEKMIKQLENGSGLKGSFLLKAVGMEEEAPLMTAFHQAPFELRGLQTMEGELLYYIYQTDESEAQLNLTSLYGKDGLFFLKSDLISSTLSFPGVAGLMDLAGGKKNGNAPIISVLPELFSILRDPDPEQWNTAFAPYEQMTELWLARFPLETAFLAGEDGASLLEMTCVIPWEDVKSFLTEFFSRFLADERIEALLSPILTEEQKAVYLNQNLGYYYVEILSGLTAKEDLVITRLADARSGVQISTRMLLPLSSEVFGYDAMQLDQDATGRMTVRLRGDNKSFVVSWPADFTLEGSFDQEILLGYVQADRKDGDPENRALRIRLTGTVEQPVLNEEDGKTYETYDYVLTAVQDETIFEEEGLSDQLDLCDPLEIHLHAVFSGKNAQQSPTALAFTLEGSQTEKTVSLSGSLKSASPWILVAPETEGSLYLPDLDESQRQALREEAAKNAQTMLKRAEEHP